MIGRVRTAMAAVAAALALVSCSAGDDPAAVEEVTVTAAGTSVTLPAAISCIAPAGANELSCVGGDNDDTAPHLAVGPDVPLEVAVPPAVADTPWVIVFSYIDADGVQQGDRTRVFPAGEEDAFTLTLPAGAQLTRLEVQSLFVSQDGGTGEITFPAIGTWVLLVGPPTD